MRDPLHWMSVKHKLALAFAGLCLLAFGVGGYLISNSARSALRKQIDARIEFQCHATAGVLDERMRLLGRRTEDFASDGFLRERADALLAASDRERREHLRDELRRHLKLNKLPLVSAFTALTIVGVDGRLLVHASGDGGAVPESIPIPSVTGPGLWHSELLGLEGDGPPRQIVTTPLRSLDGTRTVARLVAWVDPATWIASSLKELGPGPSHASAQESVVIRIRDRLGASVVVPAPGATRDELRFEASHEAAPTSAADGLFTQDLTVPENGWTVHVRMRAVDLFAPVSGLQSRFLAFGAVLAFLCALLLFFPMQFLVRPLVRLREAARQIRNGDYSVRVPTDSADEVGELARSFNHMAEAVDQQTRKLRGAAEELRARQRELRAQHERLDTVIRSLRDGLVVLDADGRPVLANTAAAPLLEVLDDHDVRLSSRYACQSAAAADCTQCLLQPDAAASSCLLDAGSRVLEVHTTQLPPDADGRCGRVLVARDVTDRIEQDEQDIHRERLSVLGEVAAVMAHELNNPLTSIRMFAQMLTDGLAADSPFREHAQVIVRNTETCRHTIGALLGYATASAPEAGPVSVHDVADDVVRFVRPLAERAGVHVGTRFDAASDCVLGDEIQIRQLLVNLVLNAVQAAGDEPMNVTMTTRSDGGAIAVEVADDGPGIPESTQGRIFDAFFSTKPRGEGTGLGLPTARRIAELHGGGIELVESRPGSTVFRVRLRLAPGRVSLESGVA